jgi:hypothetical protein
LEKGVVQNTQSRIGIDEAKAVKDGSSDDGCAVYGEAYRVGVKVSGKKGENKPEREMQRTIS